MSYEDRVSRGAELLDRVRPGWAVAIAADRLAMESCNWCILGQLYGHYAVGWHRILEPLPADQCFVSSSHGFTLRDSEQDLFGQPACEIMGRFAELADAWRAAIRERIGRHETS